MDEALIAVVAVAVGLGVGSTTTSLFVVSRIGDRVARLEEGMKWVRSALGGSDAD